MIISGQIDFIVPVDDAHRFFENSIDSSYPNGGVAIRIHNTDMKTLDVLFINDVNLIPTNDLPLFTEKNTLAALNVVNALKSKTIEASSWAGGMTSYVSCKKWNKTKLRSGRRI